MNNFIGEFSYRSPSDVARALNDTRAAYAEADNAPGDVNPDPDRVSLSVEGARVDVLLGSNGYTERVADEKGGVTISQFDTTMPKWSHLGWSTGIRVAKLPGGTVVGEKLGYEHSSEREGWEGKHIHVPARLSSFEASNRFAALYALFDAKS